MAEYVSKNYSVSKIYCSTLKRAYQTAEHLSKATSVPLIPDEHLMEFNNGLIAGLERSVAQVKYPYVEVPVHDSVYEQESALEFRFRADYMLSKIISKGKDNETVAVVTHGGMINQLYRSFLRIPVDRDIFFGTGDTGIHEWQITEKARRVIKANQTAHTYGI